MNDNWLGVVFLVCFTLVIMFMLSKCNWEEANLTDRDRQDKYQHLERMAIIQRDSMPKDSILLIKGIPYKLVKVK